MFPFLGTRFAVKYIEGFHLFRFENVSFLKFVKKNSKETHIFCGEWGQYFSSPTIESFFRSALGRFVHLVSIVSSG